MKYQYRTYPKLDHLHYGSYFVSYKNPPQITQEIVFFGDELRKTAEVKIRELLDRLDEVRARFDNNYQVVTDPLWLAIEAHQATEEYWIKKWLRYWQRIDQKLSGVTVTQKGSITDEDIERAKEKPLLELFSGDLRERYNRFIGLCPFHSEKTPSFTIFENNHYHCFGCQAHGSSIDFYMKTNGVDFIQAVKELNGY